MNYTTHNAIVNFIWGIADDVLRDVYVRGKYRDVILPMTVLRRLDCLLEPTKDKVLELHKRLEEGSFGQNAIAQQLPRITGIERQTTLAIQLEGDGEITPIAADSPGGKYEAQLDTLSHIIQEFNDRFGNIEWTENDKVRRFLFEELPAEVSKDEEYQNAKKYSDRQNAKITFEKKLVDKFQEFIFDHTEAYRKFTDDDDFKTWLANTLFDNDYD